MTRHQRRKLARSRKDAKAAILNSRAISLLQREKAKRNLETSPKARRSGKLGNRAVYTGSTSHSAAGANGKKLFDVANGELRNRVKPRRRAHSQFNSDTLTCEGVGLNAAKVKAEYGECLPNCQRPGFKGPFVWKPK